MPSKLSPIGALRTLCALAISLASAASAQQMPVAEAFTRDFDPAV